MFVPRRLGARLFIAERYTVWNAGMESGHNARMSDAKQARRVVQLMVLAAWADGHVAGSEAITIQKLVNGMPLLDEVGPIAELCSETRARLVEEGMDECLITAATALRDREYKELAFQCCARVMGADSIFAAEE